MSDPNHQHTYTKNNNDRKHITDGPCWCNPMRETVEPFDFDVAEPLPPATEPITGFQISALPKVFVNVGPDDEPLWVDPDRVDAVGLHGNGTLIVLRSGTQLVAKGKVPSEVAQLLADDVVSRGDSES